jgi:SAM-dependent methyltransferase
MSETFDPAWLALREPVDHRSRAGAAPSLLAPAWRAGGWSRVVDLGSGTGSNLRYLAPRLPGVRHWTLVDHDAGLLARAAAPDGAAVARVVGDLAAAGLAAIGESGADLVTGSALLDLVSEDWLHALAASCRQSGCAALFALTYDGGIQWQAAADDRRPADDPDDALVRRAVNSHQRRDKGLGPALGPLAGLTAETLFRAAGYRVWLLPSPWRLGPGDAVLAQALVDGWESAAAEQLGDAPEDGADGAGAVRVRDWAARRRATIASGRFGLTVGHLDLLALPD